MDSKMGLFVLTIWSSLFPVKNFTKIFLSREDDFFKRPRFWIAVLLVGIIAFIYYEIRFSPSTIFNLIPFTLSLAVWEVPRNIIGSLFYIALLYSIIFLWWKGALVVWLLSISLLFPILIHYYYDSLRILINMLFLSIPTFIFFYISLELKWRDSEKKIYEEREKVQQNYLSNVFKAQEDERARIAQEIHDDSIQRLAVIAGELQIMTDFEHLKGLSIIKERMESINNMIIDVARDLRRITLDLRPTVLDDLGILPALRWLVDNFKQFNNFNIQLEIIGDVKPVSKRVSTHIFRIVQEALNNVKLHSEATNVILKLHFFNNTLRVILQDNGKGFSLPKTNNEFTIRGKMGIAGICQRVQFIDGKVLFRSEIGKGTTISIEVNL